MKSETDRALEEAYELGRRNAEIVELARHHCLNMEFQQSGGRGLAEEASGLPINTRRVHCAFGKPANSMAMNLEWIAVDFYEENCGGCPHRRPTGQVPNLATLVDDRRAAAEKERKEADDDQMRQRAAWELRQQIRQAMRSAAAPAMATAVADIGLIDHDPTTAYDQAAADGARRRLEALADRGSEFFTEDVVEHMSRLIRDRGLAELLGTLRRLALRVQTYRRPVVTLALSVLENRAVIEAARCLVDLHLEVSGDDVTEPVVESLVLLAGQPERDDFGRQRRRAANNDPAGLRIAADLCPEKVHAVLRHQLRVPATSRVDLELPLGVRTSGQFGIPTDFQRCAAAGAVRSLAATHAELVGPLVDALVENLRVEEDDRYGMHPVSDVQRTLAILFILRLGDVLRQLDAAAASGGEEFRERLFGVFERARWLVTANDRWREPDDPDLEERERFAAFRSIVSIAFDRVAGDWGEEVSWHAAALLEDLAKDAPEDMVRDIPAVLGSLLSCVQNLEVTANSSDLTLVNEMPQELRGLEVMSRRFRTASAAGRLRDALEHLGRADCSAVLDAVSAVIVEIKDTPREAEVTWRLLPLLGALGRAHGSDPGILRRILPSLYTYLVHSDQALRAQAIEAVD